MPNSPSIANHYARMQITTAGKPAVVCMLHQRCCQLINQSLAQGTPNRESLNKAQNILVTLERTLQIDDEIAEGLFYLYDYCYCRLETSEPQDHKNASTILQTLRDTFEQMHPRLPIPK